MYIQIAWCFVFIYTYPYGLFFRFCFAYINEDRARLKDWEEEKMRRRSDREFFFVFMGQLKIFTIRVGFFVLT